MNSARGFALVLILWMLAILSLIAIGFGHRVRMENRAASYQSRKLRALSAAKAGVALAVDELRDDASSPQEGSSDSLLEEWSRGGDEESLVSAGLLFTDDLGETRMRYDVTDECGKINLNHDIFSDPEGGQVLKAVLAGLGLDPPVCNNVVRWRNERGFETISDLLAVEGITTEDFHGTEARPGLKDLLTVGTWIDDSRFLEGGRAHRGRLRRLGNRKIGWINVNTVSPTVLGAILPTVTSSVLETRPFETVDNLEQFLTGILEEDNRARFATLQSDHRMYQVSSDIFSIRSTAWEDDQKVSASITGVYCRFGDEDAMLSWTEE